LPIVEDFVAAGLIACNRENPRQDEVGGVETVSTTSPPNCLEESLDSLESLLSRYSLLHEKIQQAIERSLPTRKGQRHRLVFELARELRALPEMAEADPRTMRPIRPILKQWRQRALPYIKATTAFEETWLDFVEGWGKVKYPKGQGPLDLAFQRAIAADVPAVAGRYEQPPLRLLVALARELQRVDPSAPFYLACREAGRLLGVSHVHVSRWLRVLTIDGVLELVSIGTQTSGKASRYRYLASLD
jgi:hypothetical protein